MADAFRRAHARIPCDREAVIFVGVSSGRRLGEGRLLDASLSGAYLRYSGELQRGTPYRLSVEAEDGPLELPFRVAREGPRGGPKAPGARHYGLIFNLSADQERRLRRLLDVLRRHPPAAGENSFDQKMRDYWSS
jgi:hypothetical protein